MRNEIFGYRIEKNENHDLEAFRSPAYFLHGKKVIYHIVRYQGTSHEMFVVNSKGNICGLKGNYTFSDRDGDLDVMNNGFHPNDIARFSKTIPKEF